MFSSVVIGEGSLAQRCVAHLLEKRCPVLLVLTTDTELKNWCEQRSVPTQPSSGDLTKKLDGLVFDHLFSIANPRILNESTLTRPDGYSFNYHDGPLPAYAGVHGTFWALTQGEQQHGVTWHLVTAGVDEGDIIEQEPIPIAAEDTSWTLNLKCFEKAFECYTRLVDTLLEDKELVVHAQPQEGRSYWGLNQRVPGAGILNFAIPASRKEALCRAMDFGHAFNPMALPKVWTGTCLVIAQRARLVPAQDAQESVTVIEVQDDSALIGTPEGSLRLEGLRTVSSSPCSLEPGQVLPSLDEAQLTAIHTFASTHEYHDRFWSRRLRRTHQPELPTVPTHQAESGWSIHTIGPQKHISSAHALASALAIYVSQILQVDKLWVALSCAQQPPQPIRALGLFETHVPHLFRVDNQAALSACMTKLADELVYTQSMGTYARDLPLRVPGLDHAGLNRFKIVIDLNTNLELERDLTEASLVIQVEDNLSLTLKANREKVHPLFWRSLNAFEAFLARVHQLPDQPVRHVRLINDSEHQTLSEWQSGPRVDFPADQSLASLFQGSVARFQSKQALRYKGQSSTYQELWNQTARLMNQIIEALGAPLEAEEPILVMCDSAHTAVPAILAAISLGGVYVPIRVRDPIARRQTIAKACGARVGMYDITPRSELDELAPIKEWVRVDSSPESVQPPLTSPEVASVAAADPALIIYTSGSTGTPKGAVLTHRGIIGTTSEVAGFRPGPDDVILQASNLAFDGATFEIWGALLHGGCLLCADVEQLVDTDYLGDIIRSEGVTALLLTTALFHLHAVTKPAVFSGLRFLESGGDVLNPQIANRVLELGERAPSVFINGYGPTENTTWTSTWRVQGPIADGDNAPVGTPFSNTTLYVLDRFMRQLPPGIAGELHIGGERLALGYIGLPKRTAQVFVPNPHQSQEDRAESRNATLYKSGDLVRWRQDGTLEFLGRVDQQVKIRGFRVEIGEIESVLSSHPKVHNCGVVALKQADGFTLVAWVEAHALSTATREELTEFLRGALPDYMVPSMIESVDALPLTANGKLDRTSLLAHSKKLKSISRAAGLQGATNEREEALISLWETVFQHRPIGIHDDFFQLGGHSLIAAQVIAKIRTEFGVSLNLIDIFSHPTVAALAKILGGSAPTSTLALQASKEPLVKTLPLSLFQRSNWQLLKRGMTYNVCSLVRFRHPIVQEHLIEAIYRVLTRHEVFWMSLDLKRPLMHRQEIRDFPIPVMDWAAQGNEHTHFKRASSILFNMGLWPYQNQVPCISIQCIRSAESLWYVALVAPHVFVDGLALQIVVREICAVYESLEQGQKPLLPEIPLRLQDYLAWEKRAVSRDYIEQGLAHYESVPWQDPNIVLPKSILTQSQHAHTGCAPNSQVEALIKIARAKSITVEGLFMYAAFVTSHLVYRRDCIRSMSSYENREAEAMQSVPFMMASGILLQSIWRDDTSFIDGAVAFTKHYLESLTWPMLPSSLIPNLSLLLTVRGKLKHFWVSKIVGRVASWFLPSRSPKELMYLADGAIGIWRVLFSYMHSRLPWTKRFRSAGCFINVTSALGRPPSDELNRLQCDPLRVQFPMPSALASPYLEIYRDSEGVKILYQSRYRPEAARATVETFLGVVQLISDNPQTSLSALRRELEPVWRPFQEEKQES